MSPRRRLILSLFALVVAATATACGGDGGGTAGAGASAAGDPSKSTTSTPAADGGGGSGGAGSKGVTVVAKSLRFQPGRVEVAVGDTVTWQFKDGGLQHNVVASDFTSPLKRSGSFSHTFTKAGTYSYRCTLHPAMKGVVEVS